MKLNELYSLACGLKIGKQFLLDKFYPLPFTAYITLHASSGMAAKNYPYWTEVLILIEPLLSKREIHIVQLGGTEDVALPHCYHLQGKTSIHQTNYILSHALAHIGNDSWTSHRSGAINIPLLTAFGPTSSHNHSAYTYNPAKTSFIESHRWGRNPTFASQENPSTIVLIPPEQVANEILRLLDIPSPITLQSRMIGPLYPHLILDLIPNTFPAPTFLPEAPITVRMDQLFNEEVLVNLMRTGRKVNILTNRPINLEILNGFRQSILSYNHELNADGPGAGGSLDCPLSYVEAIKTVCPRHVFFTRERDEKKLADLRFRYLDRVTVEQVKDATRDDYLDTTLHYLNAPKEKRLDLGAELEQNPNRGKLRFKTNRFILSDGKIYLSYAHLRAGQSIEALTSNTGDAIDESDFWRDAMHIYTFFQPCPYPNNNP